MVNFLNSLTSSPRPSLPSATSLDLTRLPDFMSKLISKSGEHFFKMFFCCRGASIIRVCVRMYVFFEDFSTFTLETPQHNVVTERPQASKNDSSIN